MRVLYKIAPNVNKKSPIFTEDKFSLVKFCLTSFLEAFRGEDIKIHFILDNCPPEYEELVKPYAYSIIRTSIGNPGIFRKQVEIASSIDDYVLFQEDDYYWLPNTGYKLIEAVKTLEFVTPQDEYLYYFNEPRHLGKFEIRVIGDHHWREVNSTTLTFATHGRLIKENEDIIYKHEIWDYPMWQEIRGAGYRLWGPIPTLATHLVKDQLSPCVDWEKIWQR